MSSTSDELRAQWVNPGDILSLLLLIGGDIVQKAIAQQVGYQIPVPGTRKLRLSVAPVAFSFGWVAYGFSNLLSAMGDRKLMPTADAPSILVNCSNSFARETQSWALGRLLRDHEAKYEVDSRSKEEGGRAESIRIDIFTLGPAKTPSCDFVWWLGWLTILAQIAIAIRPWVRYGDWGVMMIALCGNFLAAVTCALPQWTQEKWAGRKLGSDKVTCLTRGNGHAHVMVFIGSKGSWDFEGLATGISVPRPETRWISLALAILWTGLLISVSGLKGHAWFLVGIGGIGMLQNVYAAGKSRDPGASAFQITEFDRAPTIVGKREDYDDDDDAEVDLDGALKSLAELSKWAPKKQRDKNHGQRDDEAPTLPEANEMPRWLNTMSAVDGTPEWLEAMKPRRIDPASNAVSSKAKHKDVIYGVGVHGALMELERWVPSAGLAMVQVYFPSGLNYNDASIRDNVAKKFWKRAYHTVAIRKRAEEKRRKLAGSGQGHEHKSAKMNQGQEKGRNASPC